LPLVVTAVAYCQSAGLTGRGHLLQKSAILIENVRVDKSSETLKSLVDVNKDIVIALLLGDDNAVI
jgi:hypothetical protein